MPALISLLAPFKQTIIIFVLKLIVKLMEVCQGKTVSFKFGLLRLEIIDKDNIEIYLDPMLETQVAPEFKFFTHTLALKEAVPLLKSAGFKELTIFTSNPTIIKLAQRFARQVKLPLMIEPTDLPEESFLRMML